MVYRAILWFVNFIENRRETHFLESGRYNDGRKVDAPWVELVDLHDGQLFYRVEFLNGRLAEG